MAEGLEVPLAEKNPSCESQETSGLIPASLRALGRMGESPCTWVSVSSFIKQEDPRVLLQEPFNCDVLSTSASQPCSSQLGSETDLKTAGGPLWV